MWAAVAVAVEVAVAIAAAVAVHDVPPTSLASAFRFPGCPSRRVRWHGRLPAPCKSYHSCCRRIWEFHSATVAGALSFRWIAL